MRRAAMVRIHKSEVLLALWLSYYSRYFEDIHVFAGSYEGSSSGTFEDLHKEYNFNLIKMDDVFYSEAMHHAVFAKQKELLVDHEWVLYADADEFVIADPEKYDGLRHFMDVCKLDQTYCEGFEVFQSEGEYPLDYSKPILQQRKFWCKDGTKSYSKPLLSRVPTDWDLGFHYIKGEQQNIENIKDTGLFLLHMKHADTSRAFDFPNNVTGTHFLEKTVVLPIPDKMRRMF